MKSKKAIYFLLSFLFALAAILPFQPAQSEAAAKVGYVAIDKGVLNVRSAPSTKAKVIGSLKNNASVSVYSQSKSGWSEIGYEGKRAYVASQYLRMYSYLMDKTKQYTYSANGETFTSTYVGKYEGWDEWTSSDTGESYLVYENNKGLYVGWIASEYYAEIVYPIKKDKTWKDAFDPSLTYKITGTDGILTTKAGKFRGVITVKASTGYINYYAPNTGIIKQTYKGKTISELIKLEKN
ncbi:SH3 domain-containing protein [Domibacillus sp. A3M-37]|uniref:SH3 domain-containing protein n=1 Tax=Domibacillus sp. A3M-37 TaxID=2962037 RepID=UPI0020B8F9AE|nr:SH3 domain-containing protein [Domibacillus sp. A3M-37]MCP3761422.1 SH3 domain-containing protein [Domibacillus sp. A3M-37]